MNSQLKSHKRFASAFERYCQLVDNARLYCTNSVGAPPSVSTTLPSGLSAMHPVLLLFFLVVTNAQCLKSNGQPLKHNTTSIREESLPTTLVFSPATLLFESLSID